jgi:hypothetical protein
MIDPAEKQTQPLALEQPKRGRGRPATGAAMTPAEKQKAYRQRLAEQRANQVPAAWHKADRAAQDERIVQLERDLAEKKTLLDYWIDRAKAAELQVAELIKPL